MDKPPVFRFCATCDKAYQGAQIFVQHKLVNTAFTSRQAEPVAVGDIQRLPMLESLSVPARYTDQCVRAHKDCKQAHLEVDVGWRTVEPHAHTLELPGEDLPMEPWLGGIQHHQQQVCTFAHGNHLHKHGTTRTVTSGMLMSHRLHIGGM